MSALPPGPTSAPLVQAWRWGLRPAEFLQACRAAYGETFTCRFTGLGEAVFFSDPQAAKDLFAGDADGFRAGKTKFVRPILGEHSLLCLDGEEHLRQRKLLLPAFHGDQVRRMRSAVDELAEREVATWRPGQELRLLGRMQQVTMEAILQSVFGMRPGARRDRLRGLLFELGRLSARPTQLARLSVLRRDLGAPPRAWTGLGRLLGRIDREIYAQIEQRRREEASEGADVLGMLLGEGGMSDRELRDELMTMLLAGHETTSTTLAWAFERLVRHPDAWTRLRDEAAAGETGWADAVTQETLRVRPVLWLAGRTLTRPACVGGVDLPAGTLAYACSYLTHTRDDLWPDPQRFDPGRFTAGKPQPFTLIPFGGGRRRCLGAAFAQMEVHSVLIAAARRVDLRAVDAADERMTRRGIVVAPGRGARVRVL
jgi:cytochrome P450 family 135